MLYFLTDDSDEAMDFAEECYNTLDIKEAMESVEGRIGAKLPDKLKEFVGHTPLQVCFGALLGLVMALLMSL